MEIKNIVRPSVRTQNAGKEASAELNDTTSKDYIWYLKSVCGGQDKYEFDDHNSAREFGWSLREKHGNKIKVEITVTTVRVWLVNG